MSLEEIFLQLTGNEASATAEPAEGKGEEQKQ
jgi:hypothetical protein